MLNGNESENQNIFFGIHKRSFLALCFSCERKTELTEAHLAAPIVQSWPDSTNNMARFDTKWNQNSRN